MLEEKQAEVPKTGPQCNGAPGPQKSILDFFKSPGKENSNKSNISSITEYFEKSPQSSVPKSPSKGKPLKLSKNCTSDSKIIEHVDEIETSQLLDTSVSDQCSSKKKKKHKKSKKYDRETVEFVEDEVVDVDDSFDLQESINNQSVSNSSKKKKSKKEKHKLDSTLDDEDGSLCSSRNSNKGGETENIFIQSQDRDCCAISDEVSVDVGCILNDSRNKKHKHKKLRRRSDDTNVNDEMSKDIDDNFVVDDSNVEINTCNDHISKHHKKKREKRNKHESDSFLDVDKNDTVVEINSSKGEKICNDEKFVSVEEVSVNMSELEENMASNSNLKQKEETDISLKKTGIKRKLELSFESTCKSDNSYHGCKKSKTTDKSSENKEPDCKSNEKAVEMSYHDYLQTLVSTVDSCNKTVDDSTKSSTTKNVDSVRSETKGRKTKLKDNNTPNKNVPGNCDDDKKKTDENETKPKENGTPSITNFFTKKSESKSNEESPVMVIHADIHHMPSMSSVKQSSQKKENAPALKSLTSSSPGVMNISEDIEILSSEICTSENPIKNTKKQRSCSSSKKKEKLKKVTENTATINTAIVEKSAPSTKCENVNNSTPKKKEKLKNNCGKNDRDIEITEIVEKSDSQVKSHKKKNHTTPKKNNINPDPDFKQTDVDKSVTKLEDSTQTKKRDAFLKSTGTVTVPVKTAQAKLSFTKSGLLSNKSSPGKVTHKTRVRNLLLKSDAKSQAKGKSKKVHKMSKRQKSCPNTNVNDADCVQSLSAKKKNKKSKVTTGDKVGDEEEIKTPVRRPQRTKYKVSSLQFDESEETPIKMKIRFCKTVGEENYFTPKSLKSAKDKKKEKKRTKAQELLHKAKKHKHKRELSPKTKKLKKRKKHRKERAEEVASNDESGRRRSSRLAAHGNQSLEDSVIEIVEEEDLEIIEKKKKSKSKLSSKPVSSPRTPKQKPSGKLAPIFMKGKASESTNVIKLPIDPEKERLRRAFLMSGIPDELKKQTITPAAVVYPEFTPLPAISHIQQMPQKRSVIDVWQLPSVSLSLRDVGALECSNFKWSYLGWNPLISKDSKHIFENFYGHDQISEEVIDKLIDELKVFNRNYPFADLFKELQTKRQDDVNSLSSEEQTAAQCLEAQIEVETVVNGDEEVASKKKKHKKRGKGSSQHDVPGEEKEKKKDRFKLKKDGREKSVGETAKCVKPCLKELMWTDRYQPSHSCEVIGHSKNITRMKTWLLEWKHRTHLEERKMRQRLKQQTRGKSTPREKDSDLWDSDCSDFDIFSEDSDEDEDRLCNTLLITGPTGIGKTATVYALAQELGYKVIEVNASSSRNGKRILSQLQEATQSHQVAQSKEGTTPNGLNMAQSNTVQAFQKSQEKPVQKLPTAFTNLFQKAAAKVEVIDVDKMDKKHKKSKKSKKEEGVDVCDKRNDAKRKRETDSKDGKSPKKAKKDDKSLKLLPCRSQEESSQTGSLNLSSTTLILFDEVDIFFEDFDKGFLPAVQHFMNTTKIPIILTTNDSNFCHQLQTRFEQITFKPPALPDIVSHLQTLCLVDNLRSDYNDIVRLVRFFNGDIRKSMLALQFWVESGGSCFKERRSIATSMKLVNKDDTLSDTLMGASQDTQGESRELLTSFEEDESEFVILKKSSKGSRSRIIYDDDSNCNPFPVAMTMNKQDGENLPAVHCIKVERLLGATTSDASLEDSICQYLQGSEVESLLLTLQNLQSSSIDVIYENILHFLPLPKIPLNSSVDAQSKITAPAKKLQRIKSDIFDNEESLDSIVESEEETSKEPEQNETTKHEKVLSLKSLNYFSDYYETMSFIDTLEAANLVYDLDNPMISDSNRASLSSGLHVSVAQHEHPQWSSQSLSQEVLSELELRSARTFHSSIHSIIKDYKNVSKSQEFPDSVKLPVEKGISHFTINKSCGLRVSSATRKARENVTSVLPLSLYCHPQVFSLDYLPTLRAITKAEQLRQVAKAKRRFHHYFDHIGLMLKESTLNVLLNTF